MDAMDVVFFFMDDLVDLKKIFLGHPTKNLLHELHDFLPSKLVVSIV